MNISFSKNYRLVYTKAPFPEYPGGGPQLGAYKVTAQDVGTFRSDAILVGRLEKRFEDDWNIIDPNYIHRYDAPNLNQPRSEIGTWVDENRDGVIDREEVRSFEQRVGDTNPDLQGKFTTITTDLNLSRGDRSAWYINESLSLLNP